MRVRFWPPVTTTGDCDSDSTYGSERRLPSLWCVVPHQSLAEELLFSQGTENACWNSCHDRVLGNIVGHDCTPTEDRVGADSHSGKNRCVHSYIRPGLHWFDNKVGRDHFTNQQGIAAFGAVTRKKLHRSITLGLPREQARGRL